MIHLHCRRLWWHRPEGGAQSQWVAMLCRLFNFDMLSDLPESIVHSYSVESPPQAQRRRHLFLVFTVPGHPRIKNFPVLFPIQHQGGCNDFDFEFCGFWFWGFWIKHILLPKYFTTYPDEQRWGRRHRQRPRRGTAWGCELTSPSSQLWLQ